MPVGGWRQLPVVDKSGRRAALIRIIDNFSGESSPADRIRTSGTLMTLASRVPSAEPFSDFVHQLCSLPSSCPPPSRRIPRPRNARAAHRFRSEVIGLGRGEVVHMPRSHPQSGPGRGCRRGRSVASRLCEIDLTPSSPACGFAGAVGTPRADDSTLGVGARSAAVEPVGFFRRCRARGPAWVGRRRGGRWLGSRSGRFRKVCARRRGVRSAAGRRAESAASAPWPR